MDSVQIWAGQLARNDFPPVCAMTGRPAETWRKFTFRTPPPWTYALLVLVCVGLIGIIVFVAVVQVVSLRATGYLPLTRSSRIVANVMTWVPVGLILGAFVLMTAVVVGAIANVDAADANAATIGGSLFLLGMFLLILGLVGRLVVSPFVVPRAKVEQRAGYGELLVDLRNVHPNFVAAVKERHQTAMAQSQFVT